MKTYLIQILALVSLTAFSQEFNGEYISLETSYRDYDNDKENFTEETLFNVAIIINNDEGYVAIQDPRIPDKPLIYRVTEPKTQMKNLTVYNNCISEHLEDKEKATLVLYIGENGKPNLMIEGKDSSQFFKNLVFRD